MAEKASIIKTKSFELAILARGDEEAKKLALLLPGRLDSKDYACFVSHAEFLSKRGFYAAAFDPPGTWESPGNTADLYTTTNYIKAVHELIEHFGNRPTLLMGHSRGAAVSILASSNPAVNAIVPVMANFGEPTAPSEEDIKQGFKLSFRDLPPGTSRTDERKEFKLSIAYWTDGEKYNAGETLKSCAKPKLIVYGAHDEFTPVDAVKTLFGQIPEPKMLKEVDCGHNYRYHPEIIKEVEQSVGEFLDKYRILA